MRQQVIIDLVEAYSEGGIMVHAGINNESRPLFSVCYGIDSVVCYADAVNQRGALLPCSCIDFLPM